jgi:NAD(P)-dependent dehydrogenase (short-subunit alcohol dehydrogenase family)
LPLASLGFARHAPAMPESARIKTALVTGAAKRLGRAIALELAAEGWDVAVHYHSSKAEADATAKDIRARGCRATVLQADLGKEAEVETLIPRAREKLGPLTCLVNNASVFEMDKIETVTRDSWDRHIETGLRAPLVLSQAFARQVPEGVEGNIVNMLDQRVWKLTPYFLSYTVAKMGLWTLTRTLALALAPRIRVNGIGPGPTMPSERQSGDQFKAQSEAVPLGHGATPEEIAKGVLFILSARAMTGQMIALDGGEHLGWQQSAKGFMPRE